MAARTIGFLGYDGVTALDMVGPSDVFATASGLGPRPPAYRLAVISVTGRPFRSDSGFVFQPEFGLRSAPALDTLVIPGGEGLREAATGAAVAAWVRSRAGRIRRVASVCTGIYGLAASGLLDGRRVTTHWSFADDVARRFPRLRMDADAIYVRDGKFYTAAGVTAGIDLSLALVEEDLGPQAALAAARMLVVYMKRSGGQEQFSEPLRFQTQAGERFSELAAWMAAHLDGDLSVDALAGRACMCTRHFSRRFGRTFGAPPAAFVERLRPSEARRRLSCGRASIELVASSVGFSSADSFRRAFERRFGIPPSGYRARFGAMEAAS
ncbi:MAG TPA: DJ-1/PfpI family protein [Opitutaceae bacterium]|jgi:transcriptional regulator GlxA family with amidase domain